MPRPFSRTVVCPHSPIPSCRSLSSAGLVIGMVVVPLTLSATLASVSTRSVRHRQLVLMCCRAWAVRYSPSSRLSRTLYLGGYHRSGTMNDVQLSRLTTLYGL